MVDLAVGATDCIELPAESLGTWRVNVLRLLRIHSPLIQTVLTDICAVPMARRLDGGKVFRAFILT